MIKRLLGIAVLCAAATSVWADISGNVFRDTNASGVRDALEPGLGNITVTAFDAAGAAAGTTSSYSFACVAAGVPDASCVADNSPALGSYTLTVTATGPFRVEFTLPGDPSDGIVDPIDFLQPGAVGASTVQFVADGATNVDASFNNPADYCDSNPSLTLACFVNGDPANAAQTLTDSVVQFDYDNSGESQGAGDAVDFHPGSIVDTGSVWATAYQKSTQRIFSAAFLKRHVGLSESAGSSNPISSIYVANRSADDSSALWLDGAAVGINADIQAATVNPVTSVTAVPSNSGAGSRGLSTPTAVTTDPEVFPLIGKVGFGDIEVSPDDKILYVVNASDRQLYAIDIASVTDPTTATFSSIAIPQPTCTGGIARPWGLGQRDGKIYAGVTCSGELAAATSIAGVLPTLTLQAFVYELIPDADPAAGTVGTFNTTPVLTIPLDYDGVEYNGAVPATTEDKGYSGQNTSGHWLPWLDVYSDAAMFMPFSDVARPAPLLSDIEFDSAGFMVVALMDRTSNQMGWNNAIPSDVTELRRYIIGGDILLAAPNATVDGWTLENAGVAGDRTSSGTGTTRRDFGGPVSGQGPGGGEFFWHDTIEPNFFHSETAGGALAYLPTSGEIVSVTMDPINVRSAGIHWYELSNGALNQRYEILPEQDQLSTTSTFGKAGSLGDVQLMCLPPPIEIGNRVWRDNNGNGIQDPDEPALADVPVQLWEDTDGNGTADNLVGSVITDANGNYLFSNDPERAAETNANALYNLGGFGADGIANTADDTAGLKPGFDANFDGDFADAGDTANSYVIRIPGFATEPTLNGLVPTQTNAADANNADNPAGDSSNEFNTDLRDSDGAVVAANIEITYTTGEPGANNHTLDYGFTPPVSIGSYVFEDNNGNGLQDTGDTAIPGALVELLVDDGTGTFVAATDTSGAAVANQTTLGTGLYFFDNLPTGDYRVRVTPPAGFVATPTQVATDNDDTVNDSNIADEPVTGTFESGTFTLSENGEPAEGNTQAGDAQDDAGTAIADDNNGNMTVDFGFVQPVSIGSYVFFDNDADGSQNAGDTPLPGATVALLVDNGLGSFVPVTDLAGAAVGNQTTGADGLYFFDNLPPGDYRVRVTPPADTQPTAIQTTANNDDSEGDSNIASEPVAGTYESGTFTLTADGEPAEANTQAGDGQDDAGTAIADDNNGNMTVDFGFVQSVSIGSYVFEDNNNNGLQDAGDTPVLGATVALLVDDGTGSFVAATDNTGTAVGNQTTAGDGLYFFDNLPPGDYRVQVTPPAGLVPTATQTTADDDDTENDSNIASEPVAGTYQSGTFTLTADGEPAEANTQAGDGQDDAGTAIADDNNGNMTVDFGFVQPVSIGSYVFEDNNNNGLQDTGDTSVLGATVALLVDDGTGSFIAATDNTGTTVGNQTTGADGLYFFDNLPPGDYRVRVTPPAGLVPTATQTTADDDDTENDSNIASEPAAGTYESGTFTLTANGEPAEANTQAGDGQDDAGAAIADDNNGNMTVDFGFVQPVSIGSYVFFDNDADGSQNAGDTAVVGATVALLVDNGLGTFVPVTDLSGTAVANQTTGADGLYFFDNLPPGDYRVQVTPPADTQPTAIQTTANNDDSEGDSNIASEPVAGTYESGTFTLTPNGEPVETNTQTGDGQDDAGTAIADDNNGNMTVDFGFVAAVSIGSYVFEDNNSNGLQDTGDTLVVGATVALLVDDGTGSFVTATDNTGTAVGNQTTGADGLYFFDNLPPGDYRVQVTPPAGLVPSPVQTATDDDDTENDSNIAAEPTTGTFESGTFTLSPNGEPAETNAEAGDSQDDAGTAIADDNNGNMTVDFGFVQPVSIGSYVFLDNDDSGTQNTGDTAIVGAQVTLLVDDGTGTFVAASDVLGTAVPMQVTGADGLYFFDNLPPGDYRVQVTPPAGLIPTATQTAADNDNGEDDSNIATTVAAGMYQSGTFTLVAGSLPSEAGTQAGDGQDDGAETAGNMTVDFGFVARLSLGDQVWFDANNDGIKQTSEAGIGGVTVELRDAGGAFLGTTTTDANGFYLFDDLAPADYIVALPAANFAGPLAGLVTSDGNDATPGVAPDPDNNVNDDDNGSLVGGEIVSAPITLAFDSEPTDDGDASSNTNLSVDFGVYQPLSLGDTIWLDDDNNGVLDGAEAGIDGVSVELYLDDDGIPGFSPGDSLVDSTTTDPAGNYLFEDLAPGDYVVYVPPSNFAGPLNGLESSLGNGTAAPDPDNDINDDDNGTAEPLGGVVTEPVTLVSQSEPVNDGDTDQNSNLSVDLGFYRPTGLSLGDQLWLDLDNSGTLDANEPGIAGATVELYEDTDGIPGFSAGDTLIDTDTTNGDGFYLFEDLPAGDYVVYLPPSNFGPSAPLDALTSSTGNGIAPDPDDDANDDDNGEPEVGGGIVSLPVTLDFASEPVDDGDNSAESNLSVDFGLIGPLSLGDTVWLDSNNSGTLDGVEAGISGVTVELYGPGQTPGVDQPIATDITDGAGGYLFDNLQPGDYQVYLPPSNFAATAPLEGLQSSTGNGVASDPDDDANDDDNGDPDASGGVVSQPVTLSALGEPTDDGDTDANSNLSVDFGLFDIMPLVLGDTVWLDANNNGVIDPSEPGIENVTVEVYLDDDGIPGFSPGDTLIDATTTDANGNYLFVGLAPGDYVVYLPPSNFGSGAPLENLSSSTGNGVAPDPDNDGNSDDNGEPSGGGIVSQPVTLDFTTEPTDDGDTSDQTNLTVDFGLIAPLPSVSVGDFVWLDDDADGLQGPSEPGLAGATVVLLDSTGAIATDITGAPVASQTTGPDGSYQFDNLPPGDFIVQVTPPSGFEPTPNQNPVDDAIGDDSDIDLAATTPPGTYQSGVVTLSDGGETVDGDTDDNNNPTVDFGFVPTLVGSIGDTVYIDADGNGVQDPGDAGVAGVTVTLTPPAGVDLGNGPGQPITTVTDANGNYLFPDLPPADYTVTVTPSGAITGLPNTGDPDGGNNSTSAVTLGPGENNPDQDFGYQPATPLGSIGDTIYLDPDGDGVQGPGETGVAGVTVTLTPPAGVDLGNGPGQPITTMTDANGNYLFPNLPAANYTVTVTPSGAITGLVNTGDPDGGNNSTSAVTLGAGENNLDQDFGYQPAPLGSIGDTIYVDTDGDGVQGPGESGAAGVTVTLTPPAGVDLGNGPGQPITTVTDAAGNYLFPNLPPADYTVSVTPSGVITGLPNTGDPDGGNDSTSAVTLGPGENNPDQDFGYQPTAPLGSIGDTIYLDPDGDGVQGPGEAGVPGITVTLTPPAGVDLGNGPGQPITTVTDATGTYLFPNLPPADYTVTVTPSGVITGLPNTGDPDGGNDSTSAVTLGPGENNPDQDFGYQPVDTQPPETTDDNRVSGQGEPVVIDVLGNDGDDADPTTVMLIDPNTGLPATTVTIGGEGTYVVNPDGTVTFTPEPEFTGTTTIGYQVADPAGNISPSTITVTIIGMPTAIPTLGQWAQLLLIVLLLLVAMQAIRRRRMFDV